MYTFYVGFKFNPLLRSSKKKLKNARTLKRRRFGSFGLFGSVRFLMAKTKTEPNRFGSVRFLMFGFGFFRFGFFRSLFSFFRFGWRFSVLQTHP